MTRYRLVGGPGDGRWVETDHSVHLVIVALPVMAVYGDDSPSIRDNVATYYRVGDVYRWEDLVEDAWVDIDVSDEMLIEVGPVARRLLREQIHAELKELAAGKELGRIVWRVTVSGPYTHRFRALVGPRAVERGLEERAKRLAEAIG